MKIQFWAIGKENEAYIKAGVAAFTKRIARYHKVEWVIIPVPKNAGMMSEMDLKKKEAEMILEWLKKPAGLNRAGGNDYLVALDEKGAQLDSNGLADFILKKTIRGVKNLVFVIGGAFGLDKKVLDHADFIWSLSPLTFPHQLVRLILAEQVYRACTIIKNEKYHHK
jgi:23S rRNA (pseudouridine1915-N3)-methyltransferase